MSLKTIRTILTAAAASLLMIACSSDEPTPEPKAETEAETPAEQPAQKAQNAPKPSRELNQIVEKMDEDGKGMQLTATNTAGKKFHASIGDEVDLPSEFPKDVPVFPGSTPMASMSSPDEGVIVTFKSKEEQQAIFDFYQSELANAGWEILEDPAFDNRLAFDALKDSRKVSVVVGGTTGDSRVSVIVTPEN